jgi:MFS family permease
MAGADRRQGYRSSGGAIRYWTRATPIVLGATIGMAVNMPSLVGATFSLFLKPLSAEFQWGRDVMSVAVMTSLIGSTLLYPLVGAVVDRVGSRGVLLPGMLLLGLAIMALSLSGGSSLGFNALLLLVTAAGALVSGVVFGRVLATVSDRNRGKAFGMCLGLGGGLGAALSPQWAGWLISHLGWRSAYVGLGLLPICIGFPVVLLLIRSRSTAPAAAAPMAADATAPGVTAKEAFKGPTLWCIGLLIFMSCLANNGVLVHFAAMVTDRGLSIQLATGLLSAMAIATLAGQCTAGFLLDAVPSPKVGIPFALSMLVGLLLIGQGHSAASVTAGVILFGLGIGSEYSLLPYYISRYFGTRTFGQLYGGIYAVASIAGGLGPFMMGRVYEATHSYDAALTGLEGAMVLGIVLIACLRNYVYTPAQVAAS